VPALPQQTSDSGIVPSFVRGALISADRSAPPPQLAIAINGVVAATADAFVDGSGTMVFGTLLPESAFCSGANRVEVFEATQSGDAIALHVIPPAPA